MSKARKARSEHRRMMADLQFPAVAKVAREFGVDLLQRSESHYQFRFDGCLLNFYPGNGRLYWDEKRKGPRLKLPDLEEVTLLVVLKAIATTT